VNVTLCPEQTDVLAVDMVIVGVTTGVTLNPILLDVTIVDVTHDKFEVSITQIESFTFQLEAMYAGLFVPTATLFFIH